MGFSFSKVSITIGQEVTHLDTRGIAQFTALPEAFNANNIEQDEYGTGEDSAPKAASTQRRPSTSEPPPKNFPRCCSPVDLG